MGMWEQFAHFLHNVRVVNLTSADKVDKRAEWGSQLIEHVCKTAPGFSWHLFIWSCYVHAINVVTTL